MLALPWIVFALLALFWTGGAAMTAWAIDWMAQALASGSAAQAAGELVALPVPQWIALWLDPALLQAAQSALQWALEAGRGLLPLGILTAAMVLTAALVNLLMVHEAERSSG